MTLGAPGEVVTLLAFGLQSVARKSITRRSDSRLGVLSQTCDQSSQVGIYEIMTE